MDFFFYRGSNLISTSCRVHALDTQNILIDSELAPKKKRKSCKYAEIRLSGSNSCLHNDATVIILLTSGSVITRGESRKPLNISVYHIYDNALSNGVIKSRTKRVYFCIHLTAESCPGFCIFAPACLN